MQSATHEGEGQSELTPVLFLATNAMFLPSAEITIDVLGVERLSSLPNLLAGVRLVLVVLNSGR